MVDPVEADKALGVIKEIFGESLRALYLHGSAVSSGLRPYSDVDLLAVIERPISPEERRSLCDALMKVSGKYPFDPAGRRPLEVLVFLSEDLQMPMVYPVRCEFVYGEWLRQQYEAGESAEPVHDSDLTLVLAQALQHGKPLFGPRAIDCLPAVAGSDIRRAIVESLPALLATLQGDERNVLLTLARMWLTLVTGEFASKDVAANWAASRLPDGPAGILLEARAAYLNGHEVDWRDSQQVIEMAVMVLSERILAGA